LNQSSDLANVVLYLQIVNTRTNVSYQESIGLGIRSTAYRLYAGDDIILTAVYSITDLTADIVLTRSYLFKNTVSALVVPPEPLNEQQKTFLFVITGKDVHTMLS
jgi:hypothetical protein